MKIYLKWFCGSLLLLTFLGALSLLDSDPSSLHYLDGAIALLVGALLLGGLFYYLEVKYVPRRKIKLVDRLIDLFSAYPINEHTTRFKIGNLDFYTQVDFDLHLSVHGTYAEIITFHVPRPQIDALKFKPKLTMKASICNGIQTYKVYETSSTGLRRAKQKLESKFSFV